MKIKTYFFKLPSVNCKVDDIFVDVDASKSKFEGNVSELYIIELIFILVLIMFRKFSKL